MASKRLRQNSLSFLGGLIGLILFLMLVVLIDSGESSPQGLVAVVFTLLGAAITSYFFSRFLPWLNRQFSASNARRAKTYKIKSSVTEFKPLVIWRNLKKRFKS